MATTHDLTIRGGTVIDGSGGAPFEADVSVDDGRIVAVCPNLGGSKEEIEKRVYELIELVELDKSIAEKYPHQCSGGQNQRVSIARALALNPKFIIADEAVSALDVEVQWKILELLKNLQKKLGISFLFIAH